MNMDLLQQAIRMNGVTKVVLSKMDVLRKVSRWAVFDKKKKIEFKKEEDMKKFIRTRLATFGITNKNLYFSERKDRI